VVLRSTMDHHLEKSDSVSLKDEKLGVNLLSSGPLNDERGPYTDVTKLQEADLANFNVGDVFESGPRLIDLGSDGKERPIGAYSVS